MKVVTSLRDRLILHNVQVAYAPCHRQMNAWCYAFIMLFFDKTMKNTYSIRFYLSLLVFGTLIPFIVFDLHLAYQSMQQQLDNSDKTLAMFTNIAAGDAQHFLFDGKVALQRIAENDAIRSLEPRQCENALRLFTCINPNFCSISVISADGKLVCTEYESVKNRVDILTNTGWLDTQLHKNSFLVSEPFIDNLTSRHIIALSYPIRNQQAKFIGVVAIAIDLLDYDSVHYKSALENTKLPSGSVVTIVDAEGNVVARWPNAKRWIGLNEKGTEIFKRITAKPEAQTLRAHGMDGIQNTVSLHTHP